MAKMTFIMRGGKIKATRHPFVHKIVSITKLIFEDTTNNYIDAFLYKLDEKKGDTDDTFIN